MLDAQLCRKFRLFCALLYSYGYKLHLCLLTLIFQKTQNKELKMNLMIVLVLSPEFFIDNINIAIVNPFGHDNRVFKL